MVFQRILVPVDFTSASASALDFAVDLARRIGASVTVVHAIQLSSYTFVPDGALIPTPEQAARLSTEAEQGLKALITRRDAPDVISGSEVRMGNAAEVILATADEREADLIVMGAHGGSGIERAILGDVTAKIMRAAQVPVITVRGSRTPTATTSSPGAPASGHVPPSS